MANYDGDIVLSMSLDPKDVKATSKELQDDIKDIFEASAGKELDEKFKKLEVSMSKSVSKARDLEQKLNDLENAQIPTEEYAEIQKQIDKAYDSLVKLLEKQERFIATGGDVNSKVYKGMEFDVKQLRKTIEYAKGELNELNEAGKAFTLGTDTAEYQRTVEQLSNVNNEMRTLVDSANAADNGVGKLGSTFSIVQKIFQGFTNLCDKVSNALIDVAKKLWNIASNAIKTGIQKVSNVIRNMGNSAKSTDNSLGSMLKNLIAYSLGIRGLFSVFSKLRSAVTEGINNLAQFNGGANQANAAMTQLTSSLSYLKNAWAAAFTPILSFVAPALSSLINMIASVVNSIGKLFAALSGKTSFTASKYKQSDYAAGLAKGGSKGKTAQEKYEEAQKKAQEKYEKQLAKTQEHNAKAVAKAEEKQAKAAAKLAKQQEKANKELAHYDKLNVIAQNDVEELDPNDFLADLWEDPELEEINWEDFLDASGAGDAFAEMFEEVPIDPWLLELAEKIKSVVQQLISPIKKAWDQVKDYIIKSFKDMIKKIWSLIKTVFSDFLKMWNQEATVEMLKTLLSIFGDIFVIIGNIAEGLEEAWKKNDTGLHILENIRDIFKILIDHVKNITESLKEWSKELDFSPIMESVERFTNSLKKVADFLGGVLEDLFKDLIQPFFKYVIEDGGPKVVNTFSDFIDKVDWNKLRENIDKIIQAVEHLLEGAFNDLATTLEKLGPAVADFLNSEAFTTFCDNVANFITRLGDSGIIETVFGGLAKVIGDIADKLIGFVNSDTFQNFINWLFDKIQDMDENDVATVIYSIAGAIAAFKFIEFTGNGVIMAMKFLNLLSSSASGLEATGSALGPIASKLPIIAGALADIAAIYESKRLSDLHKQQEALPETASDLNGVTKEMNFMEKVMKKIYEHFNPGETLADYMVVPSDYEKLETMKDHLIVMGEAMENDGTISEDTGKKINEALDIWLSHGERMEELTDEEVQQFVKLYKSVEDYYNKTTDNSSVTEAIEAVGAEWEKIPDSLPTEEDGKKGIKPFTDGVVKGVSDGIKNNTEVKDNGKYLVQGTRQGVEEELAANPPGNWFEQIITDVKDLLKIGSPSLVFDEIGQFLIQGLQQGIEALLPDFLANINTSLEELVTTFKTTWDKILSNSTDAWTNIKTTISNKFTELKDKMKDLGDAMKENLSGLVKSISDLFDRMKNKISNVVDSIKSTLRSLVDAVRNAVDSIKSALSGIGSMVNNAASGVISKIGNIASNIRVPHLAQGAVIPPNREFMAVLGDQKSGTNVETPLSTMVEAFNKALDARGGATNHEPIVLQLDSEILAQAVWDEEEKRYKQRGEWEPLYT